MTTAAVARVSLSIALAFGAGCDSCREAKEAIDRTTEAPDNQTASKLVKEKLRDAADTAKQICGLKSASGLDADKVDPRAALKHVAGGWYMDVEGRPRDPKPLEGNQLDKALVCTAVLAVKIVAASRAADGSVTEWRVEGIDVSEIKTPGHEWKKPSDSSDWD